MKTLTLLPAMAMLFVGGLNHASAQGTEFTYQGRLNDGANPANGTYEIAFRPFAVSTGGSPLTLTVIRIVGVTNGLFTTTIDFGSSFLDGNLRYLQLEVRTNGGAIFTLLMPRQQLTPVPYAIFSSQAATVSDGSITPSKLAAASVSAAALQGNAVLGSKIASNQVVRSLNGLQDGVILAAGTNATVTTNGNTLTIAGSSDWRLGGNTGTIAGTNFIGTTDYQPVEFKVNNQRGLRLEPTANDDTVNVIGGSAANFVRPGVWGATIGGGGAGDYPGLAYTNQVGGNFGTVAGGAVNTILLNAEFATVGGGGANVIQTNGVFATIPGGRENSAADYAFAAGRRAKANHTGAFVWADSQDTNFASTGSNQFLIRAAGGVSIGTNDPAGAMLRVAGAIKAGSFLGMGTTLTLGTTDGQALELRVNNQRGWRLEPTTNDDTVNVVGGSARNGVGVGTVGATIGGGGSGSYFGVSYTNRVEADFGTVSGGSANNIRTNADYAAIGGGSDNTISPRASFATIGGGYVNTIQAAAQFSTIGGGDHNANFGSHSTIGGGTANAVFPGADYATIPGGSGNAAGGGYSFAAGQRARAIHTGAFVWADATEADFTSTANHQFLIRATGGVGVNKPNPATALDVNGTVTATSFSGNGAGVTSLNAANLTGSVPGAALTSVPAGNLTGAVLDARLSPNVALRNGVNMFTGNQTIAGSVGIGTATPSKPLEVQGAGDVEIGLKSTDLNGRLWTLQSSGNGTPGRDKTFQIIDRTAGASRLLIQTNGNVGIGTANPATALEVNGTLTAAGLHWATSELSPDQGGSIELGDSLGHGTVPFIDFHYGVGVNQDHNVRLINNASNQLTVEGEFRVTGNIAASTFSGNGAALTSLQATNLTGTIAANNIGAGSITSGMLAAGAVGSNQLANGAATASKLATVSNWFALTLTKPPPANASSFGQSVAALGSDRVLIGAPGDDTGAGNAGAVHLVSASGELLQAISNPTPAGDDNFGSSVAAVGSDRVIIGAPGDRTGAAQAGAAYLFGVNGALLITLTNPTPAIQDRFGSSVATVGSDLVLVGAFGDDTRATDSGAAYLFSVNGALLTTFTNPIPIMEGWFGGSVAAVGSDRVLIGAEGNDTGATKAGAAYLFGINGTLLSTFTNPVPKTGERFGTSVAAVGSDRVLIGAPGNSTSAVNAGAAYLFNLNGALLTTFTNLTPTFDGKFGFSVAAMGSDRVLIGTEQKSAGAAYLFSTTGMLLTTFTNPTPALDDNFGTSVAVVGSDRVLIGAPAVLPAGAAFLFSTETYAPGLVADGVRAGAITRTALADGAVTAAKMDPAIGVWTRSGENVFRPTGNVGIGTESLPASGNDLHFGSTTRQMLNLWGTQYGIGVQSDTLYFRCDVTPSGGFIWYKGGIHDGGNSNPGGGTELMHLLDGKLYLPGSVVVDQAGRNNGGIFTNGLTFGSSSGEGIASRRTAGAVNQYGLDFYTGGINRMTILNDGRIGIGTTSPGAALHLIGNILATGNVCANTVNCASDRNVKAGFEAVDSQAILEKVAALAITRWHYTNDPATPHLGAVAQDFQAAFAIGTDDKHIATVDADGVALAAIQGLNQKLEASIQKLRTENTGLLQRLEKLERIMNRENGGAR